MTIIDHRGRDLIIIPDEEMLHLSTPELLQALFGTHLPTDFRAAMGRDSGMLSCAFSRFIFKR